MRPAGAMAPHPLTQRGVLGGEIAGDYDDGPSTRAGVVPSGDETNSGETRLGPENKEEESFGVSREWWASGKANELATVLGEVVAALEREVVRLDTEEFVLILEREVMGRESDMLPGMIWHATEDAREHMINMEFEAERVSRETLRFLEGLWDEHHIEASCVEGARLESVYRRQAVAKRRDALRAMHVALDGTGA